MYRKLLNEITHIPVKEYAHKLNSIDIIPFVMNINELFPNEIESLIKGTSNLLFIPRSTLLFDLTLMYHGNTLPNLKEIKLNTLINPITNRKEEGIIILNRSQKKVGYVEDVLYKGNFEHFINFVKQNLNDKR